MNLHELGLKHAKAIPAHKLGTSWTLYRLHHGCVDLLPVCNPLSLDDREAGRNHKTVASGILVIKKKSLMAVSHFSKIKRSD
jgi:hypothetical protein